MCWKTGPILVRALLTLTHGSRFARLLACTSLIAYQMKLKRTTKDGRSSFKNLRHPFLSHFIPLAQISLKSFSIRS